MTADKWEVARTEVKAYLRDYHILWDGEYASRDIIALVRKCIAPKRERTKKKKQTAREGNSHD